MIVGCSACRHVLQLLRGIIPWCLESNPYISWPQHRQPKVMRARPIFFFKKK